MRRIELSAAWAAPFVAAGCNPLISVAGANFPLWIFCLLAGIAAALILRPLLVAIGLDESMTPRVIVYSSLALVVAFVCWLLAWR
jgi:hypothetical protein